MKAKKQIDEILKKVRKNLRDGRKDSTLCYRWYYEDLKKLKNTINNKTAIKDEVIVRVEIETPNFNKIKKIRICGKKIRNIEDFENLNTKVTKALKSLIFKEMMTRWTL